MDFVLHFQEQHLSTLDALNFDFLLVSILQIQGSHALELVFGRHGSDTVAECPRLWSELSGERASEYLGKV
jgi:hypothetical protein